MCEALIGEESVSVPQMQALHSCYHAASCDHGGWVWNKFNICMKKGEKKRKGKKKKDWNDCCGRSLSIHIHSLYQHGFQLPTIASKKARKMVSRKVPPALKLLQVQTCKHLSTWTTALQRVALPSTGPGRPLITSRYFYHKQGPHSCSVKILCSCE